MIMFACSKYWQYYFCILWCVLDCIWPDSPFLMLVLMVLDLFVELVSLTTLKGVPMALIWQMTNQYILPRP